jgi:hypothetical protein
MTLFVTKYSKSYVPLINDMAFSAAVWFASRVCLVVLSICILFTSLVAQDFKSAFEKARDANVALAKSQDAAVDNAAESLTALSVTDKPKQDTAVPASADSQKAADPVQESAPASSADTKAADTNKTTEEPKVEETKKE